MILRSSYALPAQYIVMGINPQEREFDLTGTMSDDCTTIKLDPHALNRYILGTLTGIKLELTIKPYKELRTAAQNRYMWGVVVPTVRMWLKETQGETFTADDVYTWLRTHILGQKPVVRTIMGEEVIILTSKKFSAMSTTEFNNAVETIRKEMMERGCDIPEPTKNNNLHDFLDNR
ncbi:MAG: hypothetical protein H6550_16035 [Chitinophagales bacterium]|nr:hypothetical protein [Chitinophagales bacterium]